MALSLVHQLRRWDFRCRYERGEATIPQLAAGYGTPYQTMYTIVHTATEPDLHGLDLDTALKASSVRVPLDRVAYFIATHHTHTIRQQVEETGMCLTIVRRCRSRLGRVGILDHTTTVQAQTRRACRQQQDRIIRLLRQGLTIREVSEACEVSRKYVESTAAAHGGVLALQAHIQTYTMADVIRLLGLSQDAAERSIADGLLPAPRITRWIGWGRHRQHAPTAYRIGRADLYTFLRNRLAWPRMSIAMIRDPELKHYAQLQQRDAGGTWRTSGEIAQLAGITRNNAWYWTRHGWLADWERTTYGRATYYWHPNGVDIPHPKGSVQ